MPKEKSAGAVVFRMEKNKPKYLLLHYPSAKRGAESDYWDFPKGHIEKGEQEQETAKREIEEETGLRGVVFQKGFEERIHYTFYFQRKRISKTVVFFLAKTTKKEVTISSEHLGFQWLPYEKAFAKLKFDNAKNVLQKAHQFLMKNKKTA